MDVRSPVLCSECEEAQFSQELQAFVGTCQILAGTVALHDQQAFVQILGESVATLPRPRTPAHVLVLRGLLAAFAGTHRWSQGNASQSPPAAPCADTDALRRWFRDALRAVWVERTPSFAAGHEPQTAAAQLVRRAIQLIGQRGTEAGFGANTAALSLNVSAPYLRRLICAERGTSFATMLRRHRMEMARHLLVNSSKSVKEIAAAVGYASCSQFNRHFKQECGLSPVQFRRTHVTYH